MRYNNYNFQKGFMDRGSWVTRFGSPLWYNQNKNTLNYKSYVDAYNRWQADNLKKEYDAKYAEAKTANLQRYNEILGDYKSLYETASAKGPSLMSFDASAFEGLGDQAKIDAKNVYRRSGNAAMQGLASSGLYNTTTAASARINNAVKQADEIARINEALRRERIGYQMDVDKFNAATQNNYSRYLSDIDLKRLAFMERREDPYPDNSMYLRLMQGLGSYA